MILLCCIMLTLNVGLFIDISFNLVSFQMAAQAWLLGLRSVICDMLGNYHGEDWPAIRLKLSKCPARIAIICKADLCEIERKHLPLH